MNKIFIKIFSVCVLAAVLFSARNISAQTNIKIASDSRVSNESLANTQCADLRPGKILTLPEPKYPSAAKAEKIGGKIEIQVKIDEEGNVFEIENISGNKILQKAAIEAAMKAKFVPTLCDGKKARVSGIIVFNFYPYPTSETYTIPKTVADFGDVTKDSQLYLAIFELTEKHKIAFGYGDGNFHAEAPLTRGDFAQFLRLTLEMLDEKAKSNGKNLGALNIISAFNSSKINSFNEIKNLKSKEPYAESVRILLQNYNISFVNENSEFAGKETVTQNELIFLWTNIFGNDAIPVNFEKTENFEKTLSRGDFVLFLNESLEVLLYKLMP